jgi:hypothetical protein
MEEILAITVVLSCKIAVGNRDLVYLRIAEFKFSVIEVYIWGS